MRAVGAGTRNSGFASTNSKLLALFTISECRCWLATSIVRRPAPLSTLCKGWCRMHWRHTEDLVGLKERILDLVRRARLWINKFRWMQEVQQTKKCSLSSPQTTARSATVLSCCRPCSFLCQPRQGDPSAQRNTPPPRKQYRKQFRTGRCSTSKPARFRVAPCWKGMFTCLFPRISLWKGRRTPRN